MISLSFQSLADLAAHIRAHPRAGGALHRSKTEKFSITWDESLEIVEKRGGYWAPGLENLQRASLSIAPSVGTVARAPRRNYIGSRPHVAAHLAGSPKSMLRTQPRQRNAPVLRVCVNASTAWQVRQNEYANRGAALLSVIKQIESTGTRVELTVGISIKDEYGKKRLQALTLLKRADAGLSLSDLSFALCSECYLRRMGFALIEHHAPDLTSGTYGCPDELNAADFDVYIPAIKKAGQDYGTPQSALDYVQSLFNQRAAA